VEALRARQVRNLLALTLLSSGVPMITMGDEARRTQLGNNNGWCLDGPLTWLDWDQVERQADLRRFVRTLIDLRFAFDPGAEGEEDTLREFLARARIEWHGTELHAPDWSQESRSLAVSFTARGKAGRVYGAFNAYWEPLDFALPPAPGGWRRVVDTSRPPPTDALSWRRAPLVDGARYRVEARSMVMLATGPARRGDAVGPEGEG
jgi:glycogen operon protein